METVVVRDREGVRQALVKDDWISLMLMGSLSAAPETLGELLAAMLRYQRDDLHDDLVWVANEGPPTTDQWICIDLLSKQIAAAGVELPENPATYSRGEQEQNEDDPQYVWMNLPPGWKCRESATWEEALPTPPAPSQVVDHRAIMYGPVFARAVAKRALDTVRWNDHPPRFYAWDDADNTTRETTDISNAWYSLTTRVHSDWLLSFRSELGERPRNWLHRDREWLQREMDNRTNQWSNQRSAPPALGRDTHAFRFGPCGLHEMVVYYYFCRAVIQQAWRQLVADPAMSLEALAAALHGYAQVWLKSGTIDDDPMPPIRIIESERLRVPLTSSDCEHDELHGDCPLCQILAESDSVEFVQFCGHNLDLDVEFAYASEYEDYESWRIMIGSNYEDDENQEEKAIEQRHRMMLALAMQVVDLQEALGHSGLEAEQQSPQIRQMQELLDTVRREAQSSLALQQCEASAAELAAREELRTYVATLAGDSTDCQAAAERIDAILVAGKPHAVAAETVE